MVTNQIMKREFNGSQISQRTKDSFFNATEMLELYNVQSLTTKRLVDFLENQNTKNFIIELEKDTILNNYILEHFNNPIKCWESTRGRTGSTWMHPYLFMKFLMWLSPQFELKIIKWVYDNLIGTRINAGDNYREMCDAIQHSYMELRGEKPDLLIFTKEADFLNLLTYESSAGGKRNELSVKELDLLNQLQKLNIKLIQANKFSKSQRYHKLSEYANSYKMINQ